MNTSKTETGTAMPKTRNRIKIPAKIRQKFQRPVFVAVGHFIWIQCLLIAGSLLIALGFSLFQVPFKLAAGGLSGLGIILNHFAGTPVGLTVLALNIPLAVLGYFYLGRWRFVFYTAMSVICFSLATDFFNTWLPHVNDIWPITDDMLLASIYAGVITGIGTGIVYRAGGTVGGTSITARIIYERFGFPMSQSYLFTDSAVILIAGFVFSWEVALLATLTLVLGGLFSNFVLEGTSQVRTATIVTKKPDDVRYAILYQLQRGVSFWSIKGGYKETSRTMVFCTILRSRIAELKYTIAKVDPDAFIVIGVAQQVVGGYGRRRPGPVNASDPLPMQNNNDRPNPE